MRKMLLRLSLALGLCASAFGQSVPVREVNVYFGKPTASFTINTFVGDTTDQRVYFFGQGDSDPFDARGRIAVLSWWNTMSLAGSQGMLVLTGTVDAATGEFADFYPPPDYFYKAVNQGFAAVTLLKPSSAEAGTIGQGIINIVGSPEKNAVGRLASLFALNGSAYGPFTGSFTNWPFVLKGDFLGGYTTIAMFTNFTAGYSFYTNWAGLYFATSNDLQAEATTRYQNDMNLQAEVAAVAARPAGMVNPWTNNVDGGGYSLSDVTLQAYSQPDTNAASTNQIVGSIEWNPVPTPAFTNLQFGGSNYQTSISIQSGSNVVFRLTNGTNYIDATGGDATGDVMFADLNSSNAAVLASANGYTDSSTQGLVNADVTNGILAAAKSYTDSSTQGLVNASITNGVLAAAKSYTDSATNGALVSAKAYTDSKTNGIAWTNGTTGFFDGVLNGTNGIYWTRSMTNYWFLQP